MIIIPMLEKCIESVVLKKAQQPQKISLIHRISNPSSCFALGIGECGVSELRLVLTSNWTGTWLFMCPPNTRTSAETR